MQKKKKKKFKMHTERVGNLPNLVSCSQDGSVAGCHHSVLVSLVAWNQAAQSYVSLAQSLQNLWSGVQTEAPSLHGGTVHPSWRGRRSEGWWWLPSGKVTWDLTPAELSRSKGIPDHLNLDCPPIRFLQDHQ